MSASLRQRVAAICARLPGAEASDPWGGGHEAWKVGGKMFACFGVTYAGVAVKCADVETASMLIEAGVGARAPYFHRSWLLLPEDTPEDELAHRLALSYDLVRAELPRRLGADLPEREGA